MSDEYDVCLVDDGTMDTVVEVSHERWEEPRTYRYHDTSAYRDENGCVDMEAFAAEVVIPDAETEE